MFNMLYIYVIVVPMFALLDVLWLGVIAKDFYQTRLGHLLGPVQWYPAILFYLIYAAGVMYFAVHPALVAHSLSKATLLGALLGFFAYATYDLTNHATLRDWPTAVTVVDIIWGTVLTAGVASCGYVLGRVLFSAYY